MEFLEILVAMNLGYHGRMVRNKSERQTRVRVYIHWEAVEEF